jgi:hypothetical protein
VSSHAALVLLVDGEAGFECDGPIEAVAKMAEVGLEIRNCEPAVACRVDKT